MGGGLDTEQIESASRAESLACDSPRYQSIFNIPVADFAERGVYAASMPPGKNYVEAG